MSAKGAVGQGWGKGCERDRGGGRRTNVNAYKHADKRPPGAPPAAVERNAEPQPNDHTLPLCTFLRKSAFFYEWLVWGPRRCTAKRTPAL